MNMESGNDTNQSSSVLYLKEEKDEIISIEEIISILFKRMWAIISIAFAILAAVVLFHQFVLKDSYTSTASVSLASNSTNLGNTPGLSNELVQSEIQIIKSELIAKLVVDKLELHTQQEWIYPFVLGEQSEQMNKAVAVKNLLEAISVEPFGRSFVLEIKATTDTAEKSMYIANGVANTYLNWRSSNAVTTSEATTQIQEQRIAELSQELKNKEAELVKIRADSGVLSDGGTSIAEQRIRQAESVYTEARLDYEAAALAFKRASEFGDNWENLLSSGLVERTDVLNVLRNQKITLNRNLTELLTQYGEKHPDVLTRQAEIAELETQLQFEARNIVMSLRSRRDDAQARYQTATQNLDKARHELRVSNSDQVRIGSIEREISTLRAQYDKYVSELNRATDDSAVFEDSAKLVSEAVAPLYSNKKSLAIFLVIGSILGLIGGVGVAVLLETLDDKFYGASSVWANLQKRAVASVPELKTNDINNLERKELRSIGGYALAKPMSAFAESLRVVLSTISNSQHRGKCQVVTVTSSVPNEGKSTLSLSLGRIAAISGQRVLLIDCDVRRRMTAKISGIEVKQGVMHAVKGECDWKDVTLKDQFSDLSIIPATEYVSEDGSDRNVHNLDIPKFEAMIEEIREYFDLVILDGPPVLAVADALGLARVSDTNLMVIRSRFSEKKAVQTAIRQIRSVTPNDNIAIVINRVLKGKLGRISYDESLYYEYAQNNYYKDA
ncbi:GumC family protein [Hirschia litorea]|uniref:non-specific protein-tyrosine kinase n=1 Tax=Hirschia litorea TaxID=1199156 RepID=A0ABW2IQ17_9PROT